VDKIQFQLQVARVTNLFLCGLMGLDVPVVDAREVMMCHVIVLTELPQYTEVRNSFSTA
jgi:hypothetical protein